MEYDWKEIGNRIRETRKKTINKFTNKPYTLAEVAETCHIGKNNLCSLENGDRERLSVNTLIEMSKLFDCDIGYLLGEYDTKKRKITDIQNTIGLSESAIEQLIYYHEGYEVICQIISRLFEDKNFNDALLNLDKSMWMCRLLRLRQQAIIEEWMPKTWFDVDKKNTLPDFQNDQITLPLEEGGAYYALQAKMSMHTAIDSIVSKDNITRTISMEEKDNGKHK